MDLNRLDEQMGQYGARTSSDRFEFEKGVNRVRILTFPEILATHFFGRGVSSAICVGIDDGCPFHGEKAPKDDKGNDKNPSLRLITYVIDRRDGVVKLAELPLSVRYGLQDLQNTEGFEFNDFPMPYDVQIFHDPDNKDPKAKYRTTGIPKMEELTADEKVAFDKIMEQMTPAQYVEKRKEKQKEKNNEGATTSSSTVEYPTSESEGINPDDIPFS